MKSWTKWLGHAALAAASVAWLTGCGSTATNGSKSDKAKEADHKEGDHHDKPLTEKDVKMPDSFKAGVTRLEELHKTIGHHIEHGELAKVPHPAAEEMALVAKKMKELARKDLPEDKQTEAGRLCNEVAGYFTAIDEAADAGKKGETEAIHKKMRTAIEKLKSLTE